MSIKKTTKIKPKILLILGTTASGKTNLGVKLAKKLSGEIISADSRQVYRGMDIGTGKDLKEYGSGQTKVPYHLIDIVEPEEKFDLAKYQKKALLAIKDILSRGKLPIIVGGSGLYLQALVDNYKLAAVKPNLARRLEIEKLSLEETFKRIAELKPDFAARLNNSDRHNHRRLGRYLEIIESGKAAKVGKRETPYDFLLLGVSWPDDILRERIKARLNERLTAEDLVAEVERLNAAGLSWQRLKSFGLEYKFISQYLLDELDYEAMVDKLSTAIYRFAKRQKTWFKRWEKQGRKINWVNDFDAALKEISSWQKK